MKRRNTEQNFDAALLCVVGNPGPKKMKRRSGAIVAMHARSSQFQKTTPTRRQNAQVIFIFGIEPRASVAWQDPVHANHVIQCRLIASLVDQIR